MSGYYSSASSYDSPPQYKRTRSIKSEQKIDLQGPIEVAGSVKSGSSINLEGDVIVTEKVDAYGGIGMNGSIRCECVPTVAPT